MPLPDNPLGSYSASLYQYLSVSTGPGVAASDGKGPIYPHEIPYENQPHVGPQYSVGSSSALKPLFNNAKGSGIAEVEKPRILDHPDSANIKSGQENISSAANNLSFEKFTYSDMQKGQSTSWSADYYSPNSIFDPLLNGKDSPKIYSADANLLPCLLSNFELRQSTKKAHRSMVKAQASIVRLRLQRELMEEKVNIVAFEKDEKRNELKKIKIKNVENLEEKGKIKSLQKSNGDKKLPTLIDNGIGSSTIGSPLDSALLIDSQAHESATLHDDLAALIQEIKLSFPVIEVVESKDIESKSKQCSGLLSNDIELYIKRLLEDVERVRITLYQLEIGKMIERYSLDFEVAAIIAECKDIVDEILIDFTSISDCCDEMNLDRLYLIYNAENTLSQLMIRHVDAQSQFPKDKLDIEELLSENAHLKESLTPLGSPLFNNNLSIKEEQGIGKGELSKESIPFPNTPLSVHLSPSSMEVTAVTADSKNYVPFLHASLECELASPLKALLPPRVRTASSLLGKLNSVLSSLETYTSEGVERHEAKDAEKIYHGVQLKGSNGLCKMSRNIMKSREENPIEKESHILDPVLATEPFENRLKEEMNEIGSRSNLLQEGLHDYKIDHVNTRDELKSTLLPSNVILCSSSFPSPESLVPVLSMENEIVPINPKPIIKAASRSKSMMKFSNNIASQGRSSFIISTASTATSSSKSTASAWNYGPKKSFLRPDGNVLQSPKIFFAIQKQLEYSNSYSQPLNQLSPPKLSLRQSNQPVPYDLFPVAPRPLFLPTSQISFPSQL